MVKVAILGATGFSGEELVRILTSHPKVEISYLSSRTQNPFLYEENFPRFRNISHYICEPLNLEKVVKVADFVFLALPHTVSMEFASFLLKNNKKVIDLSADYRLPPHLYKKWYKKTHKDKKNLKKAVYGLPEFFKKEIKKTDLVANPGCYPASIILALAPALKNNLIKEDNIIIDAKSGVSGAGRTLSLMTHFPEINEKAEFFHGKAIEYAKKQEFRKAVDSWQDAVTLNPQDPDYLFNLGAAHLEMKQYSDAVSPFRKAAELCPVYPKVHLFLGTLFLKLRKVKPAAKFLENNLFFQPNDALALLNLGRICQRYWN